MPNALRAYATRLGQHTFYSLSHVTVAMLRVALLFAVGAQRAACDHMVPVFQHNMAVSMSAPIAMPGGTDEVLVAQVRGARVGVGVVWVWCGCGCGCVGVGVERVGVGLLCFWWGTYEFSPRAAH